MLQSVSRDRPFPLEWVAAVVFDRSESISCPAAKLVERSVAIALYCITALFFSSRIAPNVAEVQGAKRSRGITSFPSTHLTAMFLPRKPAGL